MEIQCHYIFSGNEDLVEKINCWKINIIVHNYIFTKTVLTVKCMMISSLENYCLYGSVSNLHHFIHHGMVDHTSQIWIDHNLHYDFPILLATPVSLYCSLCLVSLSSCSHFLSIYWDMAGNLCCELSVPISDLRISNLQCALSMSWFILCTRFSKLAIYTVILLWFC